MRGRDGVVKRLVILLLMLMLAFSGPLSATEVEVIALFTGKVVLRIDGKRRVLSEGDRSPEGVEVLAVNSERALLRVDGKEHRLTLQSGLVGGTYRRRESREVRLFRQPNGHFVTAGSINGHPVNLIVDTGASAVAINEPLARRLGLDYREAARVSVNTAGGIREAWRVRFDRVRLGDIELQQVEGIVMPGEQPSIPLLGMSFLRRLDTRTEGQVMVLRTR